MRLMEITSFLGVLFFYLTNLILLKLLKILLTSVRVFLSDYIIYWQLIFYFVVADLEVIAENIVKPGGYGMKVAYDLTMNLASIAVMSAEFQKAVDTVCNILFEILLV